MDFRYDLLYHRRDEYEYQSPVESTCAVSYTHLDVYKRQIKGLIKAQVEYVLWDPYANAFLNTEDVEREYHDTTIMKAYVWERKYELDSLCYPVKLSYQYYKETGDKSIFNQQYLHFIRTLLNVFECEQNHSQNSSYTFEREEAKKWNLRKTETLQNKGRGFETRYTGMIWSAFRPVSYTHLDVYKRQCYGWTCEKIS